MQCEEWRLRIVDREELDEAGSYALSVHLAACPECSALDSDFREMEAVLSRPTQAPSYLASQVLHRTTLRRPPLLPHLLDAAAWGAVLFVAYRVAPLF